MKTDQENKENKVFSILKTFDRTDLRLFGRFIRSPYFNKHEQVTAFYEYLMQFYPDFNAHELSKINLFRAFFPGGKYNDKKVRYLFTDVSRLLEKYLVNEHLQSNRQNFDLHLMKALCLRDNMPAFNRVFHEQVNPGKPVTRDTNYFYNQFAANEVYLNYIRPKQSRKEESNIGQVMEFLDLFYISKKLELSCETENAQILLDKKVEPFLLNDIVAKLKDHPFSDKTYIEVYLSILNLLKDPNDEKSFNHLFKRLQIVGHELSNECLGEVYQYLLNFCIKKINSGFSEYNKKIFEIYKIILENGVLMHSGFLSQWDYKNIVTVSLRLKNFSWAKAFISDYKKLLPETEKDNAWNYNMANYYFQKREYTQALKLLQTVEFTDPVYQLDSRAMLLKIYVEQDDPDALYYHFKAFRTFLDRNTLISRFHKTLYGNLILYTKKLVQAQGDKKAKKIIEEKLKSVMQVADLQWLKSKVGENE